MGHTYFVIGAGSIGRRHQGNLESLGADVRLLPWRDVRLDTLEAELKSAGGAALVIATATQIRMELIELCARLGVPFYAEKPLGYRLEAVDRIFEVAAPVDCSRGG